MLHLEFRGDGPRRFYDAQRWTADRHDTRVEVPIKSIQ